MRNVENLRFNIFDRNIRNIYADINLNVFARKLIQTNGLGKNMRVNENAAVIIGGDLVPVFICAHVKRARRWRNWARLI